MNTLQNYFEPLKASKAERLKALKFVHKNPTSYHELFKLAVSKKAKRVHILRLMGLGTFYRRRYSQTRSILVKIGSKN